MADEYAVADVDDLEQRRPAVVALARLASLAAVIEPPLLRRLRLEVGGLARNTMFGSAAHDVWDAGMEADLWLSELAHVATPRQLTLRPAVLEVLRDQLARPEHTPAAKMAHAVILDAHRRHSDMLRLEERVIWASVEGDADAIASELDRVLATVKDEELALGAVRWFTQARRRIPASVLRNPAGQRLLTAVAMHLDRVIPRELLLADRFPDAVADLAPSGLPKVETGIILTGNGIRFTAPDDPKAGRLTMPNTRPRVLEATWSDGAGTQRVALVYADEGDATPLDGIDGPLTLRTIAGDRYAVRPAGVRHIVVAVFGSHPEWQRQDDLARLFTEAVADPDIEVGVVRDPTDLTMRPEVIVVGDIDESTALRSFNEELIRAVQLSMRFGVGANVWLVRASEMGQQGLEDALRLKNALGDHVNVIETTDPSTITGTVARAIREAADRPSTLYKLDVDAALTMLHSVALAFHVRGLYGDATDDSELFGFPVDRRFTSNAPSENSIETDSFDHIRVLCEWLLAGPTRDYLSGGTDPTDVDLDNRPNHYQPGWSPGDWGWESFADYLEWFLLNLTSYAQTLRDRLGARHIQNGYAVPADALEHTRLAIGTSALPLGSDEQRSRSIALPEPLTTSPKCDTRSSVRNCRR